jgi:hypothetical protein
MIRSIDLQDNFSKTKLIERLQEAMRQQALHHQVANAAADEEKAKEKLRKAQEAEEDYRTKADSEKQKKFIRKQQNRDSDRENDTETEPQKNRPGPDHEIDLKA